MRTKSKVQSGSITTIPWEKIEQRYSDFEPLLMLVKFIRNTGYDRRLFGYTSLDRLVITIYSPAEWQRESLTIAFDRTDRKWHFEYHSKPFEPVEMEKYYPEEKGIEKFCQFIEWLKW